MEQPVQGYYSNDKLNVGSYKMLVNCCENCYFTYNIAKAMLPRIIIKNSIFTCLFLIVAYWGFKGNQVALPILQILLSSLFITELIHHINFIAKLKALFEHFTQAFSNRLDADQILHNAILLFMDYETTLAYNKAPLSNSIYKKINTRLTAEWEEIKKRYEITT